MLCSIIMPAQILDGRKTREASLPKLVEKIRKLLSTPALAIIQAGDRPDSMAFIKAKKVFAKKIGVNEKYIQLPESVSQRDVIEKVRECNTDSDIHGIIVQLPLPEHIVRDAVIDAIDPKKDADGFNGGKIVPPTVAAIIELLKAVDAI